MPRISDGLQKELEARKRCYQERIVRGLYITHPGWDAGTPAGKGDSPCARLSYQKPDQFSCENVDRYPVLPKSTDESIFLRLARLEVVARQPERQAEVFGWVTPDKKDRSAQKAFEIAKARYWAGPDPDRPVPIATYVESLEEVYKLQDTADFHANYLLRLVYLYGEMPPHLRTYRSAWRSAGHFDRDENFSAQAETEIQRNLLAFKYWLDEPFYADGSDGAARGLRKWRANRQTQINRQDKPTAPAENPDDDVYKYEMTYWSENHQILFATAEYLAGQLWPETIFKVGNHFRVKDQDKARPTDLLGRQHMEKAKLRILRWLHDRLRFGFSEFNSPGYYDEDFTALFNLADFCLDDEIQTRACMVLDLMLFDLARFTQDGSFSVTAGRCYFESKDCGYDQSVGDLIEVLFGTRGGVIIDRASTAAGVLVTSRRYAVPSVLIAIGLDKQTGVVDRSRVSLNFDDAARYDIGFESEEDVLFWWSRGAYFVKQLIAATLAQATRFHLMKTSPFSDVLPKIVVAARVLSNAPSLDPLKNIETLVGDITGAPLDKDLAKIADDASVITEGPALTRSNLYTYRSADAMLSSVQNLHAGQISFQVQACQATLSLEASVWTTYPAAKDILGLGGSHDGPNWWTGSATAPRVVQMQNAAIIAYKPHELQYLLFGHRTHAWFPKAAFEPGTVFHRGANCNDDDGLWTFGKVGDGYVGLYSAHHPDWTTTGPYTDQELIAEGLRNVFILQIGTKTEFGSYQAFVSRVSGARIHVSGLDLVTAGNVAGGVAGAGTGALVGAAAGASVGGPVGAVIGGVGGAIVGAFEGASHTTEDFECSYDIPNGQRLELHYDKGQVHYAGKQFSDDLFPRFENAYVKCDRVEWDQYFYTIKYSKYSLTHDFRAIDDTGKTGARSKRLIDSVESEEFDCSTGPRPFYVVGHNPDKIDDIVAALDAGANAVEPDVNIYEDHQDKLCISETGTLDGDEGGDEDAPSLAVFLDQLHGVALQRPELALIVFDCKPKAATPELGDRLLQEIRSRLTCDNDLNVIISVSSLDYKAIFDQIKNKLGPREGLMVDSENDPIAVSNFFTQAGVNNQSYGNGIAAEFSAPTLSPHIRPSLELACETRAANGRTKFIYVWTLRDPDKMREFIRIGVDGIIAGSTPSTFEAGAVIKLRALIDEEEFQPLIRLAKREDNPFAPPNANYGLAVHTGSRFNAGTDAMITFTLTGTLGISTKLVDASLIGSIFGKTPGRMERNAWDYITLQSPDLGELKSITVQRNDDGNAPDWFLDQIVVRSNRYGAAKRAVFNRWIETSPTTERLV
jgi:glycerophosphoryl diester phosphodiesterase